MDQKEWIVGEMRPNRVSTVHLLAQQVKAPLEWTFQRDPDELFAVDTLVDVTSFLARHHGSLRTGRDRAIVFLASASAQLAAAAALQAASGQLNLVHLTLRLSLESIGYAAHIHQDDSAYVAWRDRHPEFFDELRAAYRENRPLDASKTEPVSPEARNSFKASSWQRSLLSVTKESAWAKDTIHNAYERFISMGAHPNVLALMWQIRQTAAEAGEQMLIQSGVVNEPIRTDAHLAEVAATVLLIARASVGLFLDEPHEIADWCALMDQLASGALTDHTILDQLAERSYEPFN